MRSPVPLSSVPSVIPPSTPVSSTISPPTSTSTEPRWKNHKGLFEQHKLLRKHQERNQLSTPQYSLALKEICGLGDSAYRFLRKTKAISSWSPFHKVRDHRAGMNNKIKTKIIPTPNGVRMSIKDVIEQDLTDRGISTTNTQYYNFSMDGATVSNDRNISQVVAVLEHINLGGINIDTPYQCLPIGIAICKEKYEDLEREFSALLDELANLYNATFRVNNIDIPVDITVTIDLPLLLILLGYGKNFYNNPRHCCWRCKAQSSDRARATPESIQLRTLEELLQGPEGRYYDVAVTRKLEVEKFAQTLSSIVGSRIRDRKYKNKIQKMADRASSFWLTHVRATKLIKNFSKLTDILEVNWATNFPGRPTYSAIWTSWQIQHNLLQQDCLTAVDKIRYSRETERFFDLLIQTCNAAVITPYMHHGRCHIIETLDNYNTLNPFSNRSLESLHAINKKLVNTKMPKFKDFAKFPSKIAERQLLAFYRLQQHLYNCNLF